MLDLISEPIVDVQSAVIDKIRESLSQSIDQSFELPPSFESSPRSISSEDSIDSEMVDHSTSNSEQSVDQSNCHSILDQTINQPDFLTEQSDAQPPSDQQTIHPNSQNVAAIESGDLPIDHTVPNSPHRQSISSSQPLPIMSPKPSRPAHDGTLTMSQGTLEIFRQAVHASGPSPEPILPAMTASLTPSPVASPTHHIQSDENAEQQQSASAPMEDDEHKANGDSSVTGQVEDSCCADMDSVSNGQAAHPDTGMTAVDSTVAVVTPFDNFANGTLETKLLKFVYRVFHHLTDLYFAVDKDLGGLPEKRARPDKTTAKPADGTIEKLQAREQGMNKIPLTVSPGYGELARSGFDRILLYLMKEAPDVVRMDSTSSFLDIGSGFGKCVVHTAIRCNLKSSIGIEFIPVRHLKGQETVHLLDSKFVPGLTDTRDAEDDQIELLLKNLDLKSVKLVEGDITDEKHAGLLYSATHIYMFDVVFSEHSMEQILPIIEDCNFAVFACYHRPAYLEKLGCRRFVLLHKMTMRTTGNQSFTCYFYTKASPQLKRTRQTDLEAKALLESERDEKKKRMVEVQSKAKKRKRKTASFTRTKKHKYPMSSYGSQPVVDGDENGDEDGTESDEEPEAEPEPAPKKRSKAVPPTITKPVRIRAKKKASDIAQPRETSGEAIPEPAPERDDDDTDTVLPQVDHEVTPTKSASPPPSSLDQIASPSQTRSPLSSKARACLTGDDSEDEDSKSKSTSLSAIRQPTKAITSAAAATKPKLVSAAPVNSMRPNKMKMKLLPPIGSRSAKPSESSPPPSALSKPVVPVKSNDIAAPPPVRRAAQNAARSISAKSTAKFIAKNHAASPVKPAQTAKQSSPKVVVKAEPKSDNSKLAARRIPKKQPGDISPKSVTLESPTVPSSSSSPPSDISSLDSEVHARSSTRTTESFNAIQASAAAVECANILAVAQRMIDEFDEEMHMETLSQSKSQSQSNESTQSIEATQSPPESADGGHPSVTDSNTAPSDSKTMSKGLQTRLKNIAEVKQVLAVRHHYIEPALRIAIGAAADYTIKHNQAPKDGEMLIYHVFGSHQDPDWRISFN